MLNNGRLTFHAFEPNSGNIADTEMNRIGEIGGNEMASFDKLCDFTRALEHSGGCGLSC